MGAVIALGGQFVAGGAESGIMRQRVDEHRSGITYERKLRLIEVYRCTGNMAEAMRASGIASRKTAYLWWHRACERPLQPVAALTPRSHARVQPQYASAELREEVCDLRRRHSAWGRRRIAKELAKRHGSPVLSASGVELVLRRADLWHPSGKALWSSPPSAPVTLRLHGESDHAALIAGIERGMRAAAAGDAHIAAAVLRARVWQPLASTDWGRMLTLPGTGRVFLRSRLQLGHSLMNTGEWMEATRWLSETLTWMGEHEELLRHQLVAERYGPFSLRWDDIWVECMQYMGIVLRNQPKAYAERYLEAARAGLMRSDRRKRVPAHPSAMLGNVERDLATLQLRHASAGRKASLPSIRAHLSHALRLVEATGDAGMLAATHMRWADLFALEADLAREESRSSYYASLRNMEEAIERALGFAEHSGSPILQTKVSIDAAQLGLPRGLGVEPDRLLQASQHCLRLGYGGQARKLLMLPSAEDYLPAQVHATLRERFDPDGTWTRGRGTQWQ